MRRYVVVEDRQGGGFGMGRCYTAKEWLEQAVEWRDCDGWEDDIREEYIKFWKRAIKDGKEQELIDYISESWDIDIQPAEKALAILEADKEKWGSSEEEDETIEEIKRKLGVGYEVSD